MTTTEPVPPQEQLPPAQRPQPPPPTVEQQEDGSALVPGLLVVVAAYMIYRGAHTRIPRSWQTVVNVLGIQLSIGGQLSQIASRALDRQRREAGRAGDELWSQAGRGIQAGVSAGLQTVAEAIIWTDRNVPDGPITKDSGVLTDNTALLPTAGQPPDLLAAMTVLATANAAIITAAQGAGWNTKTWFSQNDNRVRDTHVALNRTSVPFDSPFLSPSGAKLRYPGDPKAPIGEKAGCRCWLSTSRR